MQKNSESNFPKIACRRPNPLRMFQIQTFVVHTRNIKTAVTPDNVSCNLAHSVFNLALQHRETRGVTLCNDFGNLSRTPQRTRENQLKFLNGCTDHCQLRYTGQCSKNRSALPQSLWKFNRVLIFATVAATKKMRDTSVVGYVTRGFRATWLAKKLPDVHVAWNVA